MYRIKTFYRFRRFSFSLCLLLVTISPAACSQSPGDSLETPSHDTLSFANDSARRLIYGLQEQLDSTRSYDPAYVKLEYPGGDVPLSTGVCADVIVRAFRVLGIDMQKEIHEDMKANVRKYPQLWGLRGPDKNIDHRRVPNQMIWFQREGKEIALRDSGEYSREDFLPGDVVAWMLPGNLYHIGVVTHLRAPASHNPLVVHNIGRGAEVQDVLFAWEIIGHYRWFE